MILRQGCQFSCLLPLSNMVNIMCQDMVAFSCCIFDGGHKELEDMKAAREKGWKGKFTKPGRVIRPGAIRTNGKCPMTPLEVLAVSAFAFFPAIRHDASLAFSILYSLQCLVYASNSYIQQVGLMLRGMGFDRSTFIYLASGKIYDAERNMAPLLEMFPNLLTKDMLASPEELSPFKVL